MLGERPLFVTGFGESGHGGGCFGADTADRSKARIGHLQPDHISGRFKHFAQDTLNLAGKVGETSPFVDVVGSATNTRVSCAFLYACRLRAKRR
jgi:hypothetical protein